MDRTNSTHGEKINAKLYFGWKVRRKEPQGNPRHWLKCIEMDLRNVRMIYSALTRLRTGTNGGLS